MSYTLLTTMREYDNIHRMGEIIHTLTINCENKFIGEIFLFFQGFNEELKTKFPILNHEKVKIKSIESRCSYNNVFKFCNDNLAGKRCIVTNADIFFDNNIEYLYCLNYSNLFIALTRYDKWPGYENYEIRNKQGSYDTYIFMPEVRIPQTEILFGINGCDSWLVRKMYDNGYHILNPCLNIPSYHHHNCGVGGTNFDDGTSYWHAPGYNPYFAPFTRI
jgi:hypothetical protein